MMNSTRPSKKQWPFHGIISSVIFMAIIIILIRLSNFDLFSKQMLRYLPKLQTLLFKTLSCFADFVPDVFLDVSDISFDLYISYIRIFIICIIIHIDYGGVADQSSRERR